MISWAVVQVLHRWNTAVQHAGNQGRVGADDAEAPARRRRARRAAPWHGRGAARIRVRRMHREQPQHLAPEDRQRGSAKWPRIGTHNLTPRDSLVLLWVMAFASC